MTHVWKLHFPSWGEGVAIKDAFLQFQQHVAEKIKIRQLSNQFLMDKMKSRLHMFHFTSRFTRIYVMIAKKRHLETF